jgi:hypothetical protein
MQLSQDRCRPNAACRVDDEQVDIPDLRVVRSPRERAEKADSGIRSHLPDDLRSVSRALHLIVTRAGRRHEANLPNLPVVIDRHDRRSIT